MHGVQRAVRRRGRDGPHSGMGTWCEGGGQQLLQALQALRALCGLAVSCRWAGGSGAWHLHLTQEQHGDDVLVEAALKVVRRCTGAAVPACGGARRR